MTTEPSDLDALFALARNSRTDAPDALTNRVMADAMASLVVPAAVQIVQRPAKRAVFGLGWLQIAGLTAVGVMGVVLGVMNPLLSEDLASDGYSLADLMPGLQDVLSEEVEG
jgi:hypothetical protein